VKHLPHQVLFALAALVLVLALGAIFNADGVFFFAGTHADALWQIAGFGILACGMTVVIVSGGIDLSVGSLVALCGVSFFILVAERDVGGWIAIPAAVGIGAAAGLVSGALVAGPRLQPFIATLAMMAFARGLAKSDWVSGNTKITRYPPPDLVEALNTRIHLTPELGIAVGVLVFIACVVLTLVVLRALPIGMYLYAIGDNEEAARYSGLPVRRAKVFAYTWCGALAGIAGVLFSATERQGNPDGAVGYELTAIAMVVIGGTSLSGGKGGVLLTLLGALTIGYLRKILDINAVATPVQLMITGAIIVAAVLVQHLPSALQRLRRARLHSSPGANP
jgi:ribose transport system permease protein